MTQVKAKAMQSIRAFHENEDGMEVLQAVILVAASALIGWGIWQLWNKPGTGIAEKVGGFISDLLDKWKTTSTG